MLYVKAIYDNNNDGWFIRIESEDGRISVDSLPPSVAIYDNQPDAPERDILDLAIEAIHYEGHDEKAPYQIEILRD